MLFFTAHTRVSVVLYTHLGCNTDAFYTAQFSTTRSKRPDHMNAMSYDAFTVITLTLNAAAVKLMVLPVEILLVVGTMAFGCSGVLLAVSAPVKTCTVPFVATLLNGSWIAMAALVLAVFEI